MLFRKKTEMIDPSDALPGRDQEIPVVADHVVLGTSITPPFPDGIETIYVAMGCFWGAERIFWQLPGVYTTAAGYMGGWTENPTYEETCTARTGHAESVLVAYDPAVVSVGQLMKAFWENHDPTQGMRQGNDRGTQYRSAVYVAPEQVVAVEASKERYQEVLTAAGYGDITTEIRPIDEAPFFYAEGYHQQYLHKNPGGYCGLGGTGVSCPAGLAGS